MYCGLSSSHRVTRRVLTPAALGRIGGEQSASQGGKLPKPHCGRDWREREGGVRNPLPDDGRSEYREGGERGAL